MGAKQVLVGFLLFGAMIIKGEFPVEHVLSADGASQAEFRKSAIGDGTFTQGSSEHQPTATSFQSFFLESKDPVPVKLASDKGHAVEYPQIPHFLQQDGVHQSFQPALQFSNEHGLTQHLIITSSLDQQPHIEHQEAFATHQFIGGPNDETFHFQTQVDQQQATFNPGTHQIVQQENEGAPNTIHSAEDPSQVGYHPGDQTFIPPPQRAEQASQHEPQEFSHSEFQSNDFTINGQENVRFQR